MTIRSRGLKTSTLHYIYDPFCGWCYGAAPLFKASCGIDGLSLQLHGGGMMAGDRRQPVTAALRGFVMQHDQRIAGLSGQPFGSNYQDGLLRDTGAVFDSEAPTTALLAAEAFGKEVELLDRLQHAHFMEGRRIADAAVLVELAQEIGIDPAVFQDEYTRVKGASTQQHIDGSIALLHRVGGAGFPTFALERGGAITMLPSAQFLGRPQDWRDFLLGATA